jgi:hypothetical protein
MRSFVLFAATAALTVAAVSGCHRHRPVPMRKEPYAAALRSADQHGAARPAENAPR